MTAHALLSASGSKRWMSCPPSARLEQQFADSTSVFAAEGTFAHAWGELFLKMYLHGKHNPEYTKQLRALEKNEFFSIELNEYVQSYVDYVIERINAAYAKTKDAVIMLEQRLDFSRWVPEGFGTGDVVIVADGYIEIIDLKYGKGVPVSAEGNTQMQLYGLGAWQEYDVLYDLHTIKMTIHQPRLDNISSQEMSAKELLSWADKEVVPKAKLAIAGEGEYAAGDHCRFCRAKTLCRARAEANLEMAKFDFVDPALLSAEEVGEILVKADELKSWADDLKGYALDQAENHGAKWPGWKLVEGRSNRKYTNEKEVAKALTDAGYKKDEIYAPREIFGITAMEKSITKKRFNELLSELVIKPAGKPTLVPLDDKRPEISSVAAAAADFN